MSKILIRKAAVLGAGVMGAQIAAHLVNAKVPVVLFDLPAKEGPKNGIALKAIENLKKQSPAPLGTPDLAAFIQPANYEEHLALLTECDLVIEAIAERMDWKLDLYNKVGSHIGPQAIFASNTSGLSITKLSEALPAELRPRFCGVHFFNPPRYMHLVELIPTATTEPKYLDGLETFLTSVLGKGVVRAKDTPNFIANRVGIFSMLATMIEAEKYGLAYDVVDDLTGSKLGRAKSATFRTADVVGLDTMAHVIKTMQDTLPPEADPFAACYATPPVLKALVEKGALGQKTKAGFFTKEGKTIKVLNPATASYVDSNGKADEIIARILKRPAAERLKLLRESDNPQAQFLWAIFRDVFHYIAVHLESIADTARDVDFAIRWGFGWNQGPFESWQDAGWQQVAEWVKADIDAGKALCAAPLPAWVFSKEGVHDAQGSFDPARQVQVPRLDLPVYQRQLFRAPLFGEAQANPKTAGTTVFENEGIRIWHIAPTEDVLILSFKSKMHTIGPEQLAGIHQAIEIAEKSYTALVLWHPDEPFSAGANLEAMMPVFMTQGAKGIDGAVAAFQQAMMRIKYAQVPVVAAAQGLALGGGCETLLHCAHRVAHLETYIGLVEMGVGLLPAGGGLKELALRSAQHAQGGDIFAFLKNAFMHPAMANVSKSALEARAMGFLRDTDTIVFNTYEVLGVALKTAQALGAGGYRPPLPALIPVVGKAGIANIRGQLINMRDGGFISAHDFLIASKIAEVMSGGAVEPGSLVSEQWLLDMERKAFVELAMHPKTQERIMGMLQTGKPVRN
ncbi:3-hydroxyacyl-CoA dehydrogenase/enoyl-CoA hydratase family protein [Parvibium lacunae]|uniref:3-hydroxyacyl-CoA dehydrogenase/enoyl-CoA hydratase family protein n=1 Tax=Parvibium lacunae TaxID=1888893 RepID=A0A368KYQ6_9BURK|nr:3-hydroxyacyl-CoA dehydrogenase/enoyl-CoA hydratase family protein [Parvibium lacunae]RCS56543.1 3-hydroxyacyl-CoA dehydrogenase/enoyl-CoA hydratase family protein [Parvibium lacunae]